MVALWEVPQVLLRVLPYLNVVFAAFIPLAAGIYLLASTGWALAERAFFWKTGRLPSPAPTPRSGPVPARDQPQVLRDYAKLYDVDTANWTFLTGPRERVEKVIASWGMWARPAANGQIGSGTNALSIRTLLEPLACMPMTRSPPQSSSTVYLPRATIACPILGAPPSCRIQAPTMQWVA